jgi:hypothetical protein
VVIVFQLLAPIKLLSVKAAGDSKLVVKGCRELNYCWGHGMCVSRGIGSPVTSCQCFDGWGSSLDIAESPAPDCSKRVCPHGPAWGDLMVAKPPNASDALKTSRMVAECSGSGTCDRSTGECRCFTGFAGRSCERLSCYGEPENTCSGNGVCLSLKQLSKVKDAFPLTNGTFVYGPSASKSDYWDEGRVYACHCDSSWKVGLGRGETQVAEYFGSGCEQKRCPSGDDPITPEDETDCSNITGKSTKTPGLEGNLCHVDCSNRGICNHLKGICKCFPGFTGKNCGTIIR